MTRPDVIAAAARGMVGYTYPEQRYLQLVAPGDAGPRQLEVGRMSGCMLARAGLEEALGLFPARGPYATGSAPRTLEERAGGSPMAVGGACRRATLEAPPQLGDGLWWGAAGAYVEHVDAAVVGVTCVRDSDDLLLDVVAGGQRDSAGDETVKLLQRRVTWRSGHWVDVATLRPLWAILDADLYPEPAA